MRRHQLNLMDMHAGGDVSRIVYGGVGSLPGETVRAKMEYLQDHADVLRRVLLNEPYGIPEMSVDLLVPASNPKAVTGYIIMEVMGYPVYSGSNTLCTATAVLELGLLPKQEGRQQFMLESPAGLVQIDAEIRDGVVESITCEGLPSYIDTYQQTISVPGLGEVIYSIAYSGGFYVLVDAAELGFSLTLDEETRLSACAHAIIEAIRAERNFRHYSLGDVGPIPFLHFMGPVESSAKGQFTSRSATYVHPGVICRSTTGTGTSARLALMQHEKRILPGDTLETCSLRETRFVGRFTGLSQAEGQTLVENSITGKAYVLSRAEIIVNSDDPMVKSGGLGSLLHPRKGSCE